MKTTAAILVLTVIFPYSVSAQITFDRSDVDAFIGNSGTNSQFLVDAQHAADLTVIANGRGGNQTFDFSTFTYLPPEIYSFEAQTTSVGTPGEGDPLFDTANWVQFPVPNSNTFSYFIINNAGFFRL